MRWGLFARSAELEPPGRLAGDVKGPPGAGQFERVVHSGTAGARFAALVQRSESMRGWGDAHVSGPLGSCWGGRGRSLERLQGSSRVRGRFARARLGASTARTVHSVSRAGALGVSEACWGVSSGSIHASTRSHCGWRWLGVWHLYWRVGMAPGLHEQKVDLHWVRFAVDPQRELAPAMALSPRVSGGSARSRVEGWASVGAQ